MLRLILAFPFIVILVLFALSNTAPVKLGLWPTDFTIELPLAIAVLVASGVFFFLGALIVWLGSVGQGARARRAEREVERLRGQLTEATRARPGTSLALPVP